MEPLVLRAEHLLPVQCELGEAPLWDAQSACLYWLDIAGARLYRWSYGEPACEQFVLARSASALALHRDGFLMAVQDELMLCDRQGQHLQSLVKLPEAPHGWRFNDGKADRQGRFWVGTIDPQRLPQNALFCYDGVLYPMDEGYSAANGIAWSPDQSTLYAVDSPRRAVYAYDYDPRQGQISKRRNFISQPHAEDVPDGLTVDSEGGIWCARWGGWQVVRYAPDGQITHRVPLPVQFPTSCMFGGPELRDLFITSAWTRVAADERARQAQAGDVFRVRAPFAGMPEPQVAC